MPIPQEFQGLAHAGIQCLLAALIVSGAGFFGLDVTCETQNGITKSSAFESS